MPPDLAEPGSPEDWLRFARADLAHAGGPLPEGGLYEMLCFHAQQAAEKAIKSLLVQAEIEVPFTHSLEFLLDQLPESTIVPEAVSQAVVLTQFATTSRYPPFREVGEETWREAVRLAGAVVEWAERMLEPKADTAK
jgi:HEPN domain-containing protein